MIQKFNNFKNILNESDVQNTSLKQITPSNLEEVYSLLFMSNSKDDFTNRMIENGYEDYISLEIFDEIDRLADVRQWELDTEDEYDKFQIKLKEFKNSFKSFINEKKEEDFKNIPWEDEDILDNHIHFYSNKLLKDGEYRLDTIFVLYVKGGKLNFTMDNYDKRYPAKQYNIKHLLE